jgi:Icc-related predicted phosphoesterase
MQLKIAAISDTHRMHEDLTADLEAVDADLLIHSGDADCTDANTTNSFLKWLNKVAEFFPEGALFTPGNHDTYFVGRSLDEFKSQINTKVRIIINEEVQVRDVRIYLSPYSFLSAPKYNAFTHLYEEALGDVWAEIPKGIDVLVTHSPPYGILANSYGSISLKMRVIELKPKVHIFGHVHEGHGVLAKNGIMFVNACSIGTVDRGPFVPLIIQIDGKNVSVSQPEEIS